MVVTTVVVATALVTVTVTVAVQAPGAGAVRERRRWRRRRGGARPVMLVRRPVVVTLRSDGDLDRSGPAHPEAHAETGHRARRMPTTVVPGARRGRPTHQHAHGHHARDRTRRTHPPAGADAFCACRQQPLDLWGPGNELHTSQG
ncbi:hypothetical protein ACFV4G_22400 [Kitasatospora sp. NPDC059747]|uniref:hypothetical protein n=1 Tax=Kitasatospora sp. NPDC059747 TaxID=3346930 RepID=UPI0036567D5F